jgi:hypothetical protein
MSREIITLNTEKSEIVKNRILKSADLITFSCDQGINEKIHTYSCPSKQINFCSLGMFQDVFPGVVAPFRPLARWAHSAQVATAHFTRNLTASLSGIARAYPWQWATPTAA